MTSPYKIALSDGSSFNATALVRVGPKSGMVVDPQWATLEAYAERLIAEGFGYSAVAIDGDPSGMRQTLKDWGWKAPVR